MKDFIENIQRQIEADPVLLKYKQSVQKILSKERYVHSLACAAIAAKIARDHNLQKEVIEKCLAAALLHDITKEFKPKDHQDLMEKQNQVDELSGFPKSLWHAITGRVYVQTRLQIEDSEILEAIRFHTTGSPHMGKIARIIYAADYFGSEFMMLQGFDLNRSIDTLCLEKTTSSLVYLVEKNKPVHHDTIDFYHHLIERVHGE